jgi:hypothetical protein
MLDGVVDQDRGDVRPLIAKRRDPNNLRGRLEIMNNSEFTQVRGSVNPRALAPLQGAT